ncbi:MAG: vitamin K epoxide reductase family protein [Candidatus Rokubacteria bacterium]|nr:vitamin K epoxide reductase family protein [Candidatus Rokubacteria bacterium]
MASLAAAGLAISAYLTGAKLAGATALFCESGSGCDVVQASRYAVFLGLPTAAWGAGLYLVIGGLALAGLPPRRWLGAFVLAVAAVAFSAYLTFLAVFELSAVCPWCLGDAAIAAALLAVLLARRPAATGRRSWVRPRRLATLGVLTATATIVFGMGVFVADAPTAGSAYQEALARHLTASGAIFYGAYW